MTCFRISLALSFCVVILIPGIEPGVGPKPEAKAARRELSSSQLESINWNLSASGNPIDCTQVSFFVVSTNSITRSGASKVIHLQMYSSSGFSSSWNDLGAGGNTYTGLPMLFNLVSEAINPMLVDTLSIFLVAFEKKDSLRRTPDNPVIIATRCMVSDE